ncbi:MAG: glucosaminidase domain-containing protein [Sphingobacteriales bacterium]|nr:MAG: glucosaminidase domain-containing protein [Sphingobacteriales bacterium]
MNKRLQFLERYLFFFLGLSIVICFAGFKYPAPFSQTSISDYIDKYKGIAILEMHRTGIPASITLGQGILESSYGNSYLSRNANNHFGFKCRNDWFGEVFIQHDDKADDCFRKYNHVYESFIDHSYLLTTSKRYAGLFTLPPNQYRKWAQGLQDAYYASSNRYAQFLINIIEFYGLHYYDTASYQRYVIHPVYADLLTNYETIYTLTPVAQKSESTAANAPISDTNNFNLISLQIAKTEKNLYAVQSGETLYKISRKFNTSVEMIKLLNKLRDTNIKIGQQLKIPD